MAFTPDLIDLINFADGKNIEIAASIWDSAGKTVKVTGLTRRGYINMRHKHAGADRSVESIRQGLSDYPIFVRAGITGNSQPGVVYILVTVRMGGATLYPLLSGYISSGINLCWPVGRNGESFLESIGNIRSVLGTDPAANVECSETVPTNAYWELESFSVALVADANVADRLVTLVIDDGANILHSLPAGDVVTANETMTLFWEKDWVRDESAFDAADSIRTPLPEIILPQAYRIRTVTTGRQVTDNFGAPRLGLKEWLHE